MDQRVAQFRVGVVVVVATLVTGILIIYFGEARSLMKGHYTINILFPEAPGVAKDTPVRKSGVLIGRVSNVELQPDGGVLVSAAIDDDFVLRHNELCRVGAGSLLGDAVLEFVPTGNPDAPKTPYQDGDLIANGAVAGNPLEVLVDLESDLRLAIGSIQTAGDEVTLLARNLNRVVGTNDDQLQRILSNTEIAMQNFNKTMVTIDELLGDEQLRAGLTSTLADLPKVFEDARTTLGEARTTLKNFQQLSQNANRTFDNLEAITDPFAERGEGLANNLTQSAEDLRAILAQLATFSEAINSREGSLGQLIHDPELYNRINGAAGNIEDASRRLRPIVEDVRIFTDKIARDPRQLGVKGALDKRPSGAGFKGTFMH